MKRLGDRLLDWATGVFVVICVGIIVLAVVTIGCSGPTVAEVRSDCDIAADDMAAAIGQFAGRAADLPDADLIRRSELLVFMLGGWLDQCEAGTDSEHGPLIRFVHDEMRERLH